MSAPLFVSSSCTLPAHELSWRAVRASGPGGQNVNKVASKVELRFHVDASRALDDGARRRLLGLPGVRVDADGALLVVCQETRDQSRNLELARARLAELVARALVAPKARRATRPGRGAVERRLSDKRAASEKKRTRRGRVEHG